MKKTKIGIFLVFVVVISMLGMVLVLAQVKPDTSRVFATNSKANVPVVIPVHAVEVAPNVFSLGFAVDVDGRIVEGLLYIHKKNNAKGGKPGGLKPRTSACYSLMSKGASWKVSEPYLVESSINLSLMETSVNTWDSEVSFNIFGEGSYGIPNGPDEDSPDGLNEVQFLSLGPTDTIAYTITWGIYGGPIGNRRLTEWDMVFNSDYDFGDCDLLGNSVMDFQNIAVHELGHALGLSHPGDSCTEETMYRFADYGETKKRDLNSGDLIGLNKLYA